MNDYNMRMRALGAVIVMLATAVPAVAQDVQFEPIIRLGGEYDDNARLSTRTDEESSLSGALLDLQLGTRYATQTTQFRFQPRVLVRRYDEGLYDSEDVFVRGQFTHNIRSSTVGFRVFYEEQQVRTAERAFSDPDVGKSG